MRRKVVEINNKTYLFCLLISTLFITACAQESAANLLSATSSASTSLQVSPSIPISNSTSTTTSSNLAATVMSIETGIQLATIGQMAIDFKWSRSDGHENSLSQLKGQPVILNWWASWCEPCRKEMPLLERTAKDNKGLNVIGLNLKESQSEVTAFTNLYNISFNIILDKNAALSASYHVRGLPQTVFIDKNGVIQAIVTGQLTELLVKDNLSRIR